MSAQIAAELPFHFPPDRPVARTAPRKAFGRSLRRVGVRLVALEGRWHCVIIRVRQRWRLFVSSVIAECNACGARWTADVGANGRCRKGWRRCPAGCNARRLRRG